MRFSCGERSEGAKEMSLFNPQTKEEWAEFLRMCDEFNKQLERREGDDKDHDHCGQGGRASSVPPADSGAE